MSRTKKLPTAVDATPTGEESRLAQQFGGHYANSWMDHLPASWTPYIQLARLHRPHGLIVVTLSHLFGVFHAAFLLHSPLQKTLGVSAITIVGALFVNSGAHAWNDLIDAPIDAQVERTKTRPIPRGDVSKKAAFIFATAQAFLAALALLALPSGTRAVCVPNIVAILYYPFAKRQMFAPQLVLGVCMGLCALVGSSAMGLESPWLNTSTQCLAIATMFWVVLFDTIYAHMDLTDDIKLGVNSLAVFAQGYAKLVLSVLAAGSSTLLYNVGMYSGMGAAYNGITVASYSLCVGGIIALLDLEDRNSCGSWCIFGFRFTGVSIGSGLLVTYLAS